MRARSRKTGAVAVVLVAAMSVAGCSKADGGGAGNAGGEGVDPGATKQEYQAAFEEVDSIDLSFQVAAQNPESYASLRDLEFAKSLEEWSGGKISVDIHYAGSVAAPTEVPDALVDGRLDLAHYYTTYEPDQMPTYVDDLTTSMVQVRSTPLVGEIVSHAVLQQVAFETPEIMDEFESRGMHVISPASSFGNTEMICSAERGSLADLEGAQIRGNAKAHEAEIKALGGAVGSVELAEGYEAFQRGVLDCSLQAPSTAVSVGWLDVAPHVYFPRDQGFAPGPGSLVAGSTWEQLPLVAQQLMVDRMADYTSAELYGALQSIEDTQQAISEKGGEIQYLDADAEKALSEANQSLLDDVADSDTVDGEALNVEVKKRIDEWTAIAEELGYTDEGDFDEFDTWYKGSNDFEDRTYLEPIAERMYEEIFLAARPS